MNSRLFRYIAPVAVGATVASGAALLGAAPAAAEVVTTAFKNACQAT